MRNKRTFLALASALALLLAAAGLWLSQRPAAILSAPAVVQVPRETVELREGRLVRKDTGVVFTGVMYEQTVKGQRLSEVPVLDGCVHGLARGWHENGILEVEEPFKDGLSHGIRTRWYPGGQKRNTATIVAGVLEGPFTQWHENGKLAVTMNMVGGVGQGPCETWKPDGQLEARVTLKDGQPTESHIAASNEAPGQ